MQIPAFTYAPILHDWLEDHGLDGRLSEPPLAYPYYGYGYGDGDGYGDGYGYGYGDGYGYGYGDGYGYGHGDGHGYGYGDGYGYGHGHGYGYGDGYGHGDGYGRPYPQPKEQTMPVVGERMLIFCGLSFAFCADVEEQTGPYTFCLKNASMLCNTGSVPWDELADGKRREAATFRHQGTINVGPFFSWSRSWKGELPGKDNKCKNLKD